MLIEKQILDFKIPSSLDYHKVILWDIETLGLSYASSIYMIGYIEINIQEKISILYQGMIENLEEEKALIQWFYQGIKEADYFIHFNGQTFDRPFIQKRSETLGLSYPSLLPEFDLLKGFRKHKRLLYLDNLKQKTIESLLDIQREDRYSGKELIHLMYEFMTSPSDELKEVLLCHNREDILGLYQLLSFLPFFDFFNHPSLLSFNYKKEADELYIEAKCKFDFPITHKIHREDLHILFQKSNPLIKAKIILKEKEMYYFFKNYQDYYYLPMEDMAIHKSVAQYVDSHHKQKAKASTCYQKMRGLFMPYVKDFNELIYFEDKEKKHPYHPFDEDTFQRIGQTYLIQLIKDLG